MMKISSEATKGQLISKCLFGVFNSPKKQTKTILLEVPHYSDNSIKSTVLRPNRQYKASTAEMA